MLSQVVYVRVRSSEGRLEKISVARYCFMSVLKFLKLEVFWISRQLVNTLTSINSANSSASLDSVLSTIKGLIVVFRPALFRAFLLFAGVSVDLAIKGSERSSLKSWKLELSISSMLIVVTK